MKLINSSNFQKSSEQKSTLASFFADVFDIFVKALVTILIILTFVFRLCTVQGDSMYPTLKHEQELIITNLFYSPKENDVIVFHETGSLNEPVVKRVIATGDKWVRIDYDNCLLYVSSDNVFDESDLADESQHAYFEGGGYDMTGIFEQYVPEGYLFVMGDNRNNSLDSRSQRIGLVDERTVLGKVVLRISPAEDFGFIK